MLGLGTWKSKKDETKKATLTAFGEGGYYMIDT